MPSFGNFVHTQFVLKIPIPTTSFASKTVVITGGSSGLGKEAAKHIARLGAEKIILGCRNISKGNKVKLEIESSLQCSTDIIEVWAVDIESPTSIKSFVEKVNQLPRLDVFISNAGIQSAKFQTVYGTERTVGVNVIGTFLLALQLVPKLKETAKMFALTPHLTFLGSALYDAAKYPEKNDKDLFGWLSEENNVSMMNQYNLSKLILLYSIVKLASLVDPTESDKAKDTHPIVINSLDPCFCKTELAGDLTGGIKVAFKVFERICARTAEEGSRMVVKAASAGRETHGGYMRGGSLQKYAPFITDEDGLRKTAVVWEQLMKKLEQLEPGIVSILI